MKKITLIFFLLFIFSTSKSNSTELKIIDGDTIIINGEKIRFSGIDAPEIKQTCIRDKEIIKCGKLVKKRLIEKVGGRILRCDREKEKDYWGRTLAECFVDNESLSIFLVRNGYAFAFRRYSKKFIQDEEFAKENKLGLWSMEFEYPWNYRKK